MYKKLLPELHALMMMTALMMLGSAVIPALAMPTTKGEEPAPLPPEVRRGSFEGQITPMARTART